MAGASELGRDTGHYLRREPIDAKRESGPHVLRKQWRRYRIPTAIAAGFLLLAGLVATASHWWLAEQETGQPAPSPIGEHEQESTTATILSLDPESPASLKRLEGVWIKLSYRTSEPDGVVIFVRPMSNGMEAQGCLTSPSPVYPSGTGTGETWFIMSKACVVDQLRIRVCTARKGNQRKLLHESFHPVRLTFEAARGKAAIPPLRGDARSRGQEGPRDPGN